MHVKTGALTHVLLSHPMKPLGVGQLSFYKNDREWNLVTSVLQMRLVVRVVIERGIPVRRFDHATTLPPCYNYLYVG